MGSKMDEDVEKELALFASGDAEKQAESARSTKIAKVMQDMLETGVPAFDWELLKPFLAFKLCEGLDKFRKEHPNTDPTAEAPPNKSTYEEHKSRLLTAINLFQGAPFTLQRLCELITGPEKYYKNVGKLIFGLEKLLSVSSVLEVADSAEGVPATPLVSSDSSDDLMQIQNNDESSGPEDQSMDIEDSPKAASSPMATDTSEGIAVMGSDGPEEDRIAESVEAEETQQKGAADESNESTTGENDGNKMEEVVESSPSAI